MPAGLAVRVHGLSKYFRRADGAIVKAIDGISLDVSAGEFVVLLGPSGCGKTTLLRCIAGFERADRGTIEIARKVVFDEPAGDHVPTESRNLGMVFQSYALWPHMTVASNVAYPLHCRRPRLGRKEIAERVAQALAQVGLAEIGGQYPGRTSGGQQQRAALARALIAGNDVILFDEPLSNVDAKVRDELRRELLTMQQKLGFAAVYVTHDQTEAMQLADRIAVLGEGRIRQLGPPRDIYREPASRYVANFVGTTNELTGCVARRLGSEVVVATVLGEIHGRAGHPALREGDDVVALWRPENTRVTTGGGPSATAWDGTLVRTSFLGAYVEEEIDIGGTTVRRWCDANLMTRIDGQIQVSVPPEDVRVLSLRDD